jgi:hypothetical protein
LPYVRARGVRFHVVDLGRGAAGEPLVMLHGLFTGSAASWFFGVAPELARTRPVRLPDWRGHGMSERTATGYDSATMAADLAALTAGLPPFAGRVTRLALIDPPFGVEFPKSAGAAFGDGLCGETSVLADLAAEPAVTAAELETLGDLPVLAVVGADSPYRRAGDLVGGALPASRRHVLPGGHDLHITARARLAPLLKVFLNEAPERSGEAHA